MFKTENLLHRKSSYDCRKASSLMRLLNEVQTIFPAMEMKVSKSKGKLTCNGMEISESYSVAR